VSLSSRVSVTSAMNAIAHAAEALYAPDTSPVIALLAEDGVRRLAGALPDVVARPDDLDARAGALCGAWMCGICLGATTMSLHHKLCHVLGGTFGLPHAETHTVVLPHVLAYNASAAPEAMAALARALGADPPARALFDLGRRLGAPQSLAELGLRGADLDQAVRLVTEQPYANPRPVTADGVRALLGAALTGAPPE
jgi:alcohol dehydrogenase class IV